MLRPHSFFAGLIVMIGCGCISSDAKIEYARRKFLEDPSIYTDVYGGSYRGDEHYRFLTACDPFFGDFLLSQVASSEDLHLIIATLRFFAFEVPDRIRFERAVATISPSALIRPVNLGSDHNLVFAPLSEWIRSIRNTKNWANPSLQPTASSGRGRSETLGKR